MRPSQVSLVAIWVVIAGLVSATGAAEMSVEKQADGVTVKANGQLFTRYVIKSGAKPILWPIVGPSGKEMTRGYPMREATPEEKNDHIHHRSFWFTHGKVNDIDFWSENKGHGTIEHREYLEVVGGPTAKISTKNDWIGPDGKKVCEEERKMQFGADEEARWIDCDITMTATDGPVKFGDTKEGSFGVRVNETIKVDAKKGGKIVNSEGQTDGAAWGKPAAWVDYFGPVQEETVGVAILNHPSSFRYPVHWHVRTYGLFAANPFGLHDFTGANDVDGSYTLPAKEKMTLRFRVVFHKGDQVQGKIVERFNEYSAVKR